MKLLNVRLTDEDARIVERLRREGVKISAFVREALRAENNRRKRSGKRLDAVRIVEEIHRKYPAPPDYQPRDYNVHDAQEARQAIVARLKRKRA